MTPAPADWPRIKALFHDALERPHGDRAAFLAATCGDDASLRAEVERLLAAHDGAGAFLETPAHGSLTAAGDSNDGLIGREFGGYRIERSLGRGGMGEVYLAHDAKLQRPVAIKLLSTLVAGDPDRLRRFHTEARAASALNHPNILVIHDFGDIDGRPFIVTEFVEGHTLGRRLRSGPLPVRQAVDVAAQIAGALGAAHARGITHRDVKPDNVMLRPDGYVKVVDFGLAKLRTSDRDGSVDGGTIPGLVMGTPRYMSPEQARGTDTDARSDVWSVGVMLYEMIAGTPPFSGATPADLLGAILRTDPVPLDLQAPRIPPGLARIVAKAMRKNRTERYATAADLLKDLSALGPIAGADDPPVLMAIETARSDTPGTTPKGEPKKRTRVIVIPFRLLRPDADIDFLSFSLADAIATTLSTLDSLVVRSAVTGAKYAMADVDLAALAATAEVDCALTGTLLRAGANLRVNAQLLSVPDGTILCSERIDVSLNDLVRVHDELSERIVDSLAVPLSSREQENLRRDVPASAKAYELYLRGASHSRDPQQWALARELFVECVTEDPGYAPAWARLGRCYRLTAKFLSATADEVRDNLKRADTAFRTAFELNPDLPLTHHLYTNLETDLGRVDAALRRLVGRARPRRADPELYAGLVHACRYGGLLDASVAAHERARALDSQIVTGVPHTYWMRGEYERAVGGFDTGFFVGMPLIVLGREDDARALAQACASRVRDPTTRSYQSIVMLMLEGRRDDCLRLLTELAPRNPDPESVYFGALTFAKLEAYDAALAQVERAVDMGFCCADAFVRDVWLAPLRGTPAFTAVVARARRRQADAARTFREAGGERLLGLTAS